MHLSLKTWPVSPILKKMVNKSVNRQEIHVSNTKRTDSVCILSQIKISITIDWV